MEMTVLLIFRMNARNHKITTIMWRPLATHRIHSTKSTALKGIGLKSAFIEYSLKYIYIYKWGNGFESKRNLFIVVVEKKENVFSFLMFPFSLSRVQIKVRPIPLSACMSNILTFLPPINVCIRCDSCSLTLLLNMLFLHSISNVIFTTLSSIRHFFYSYHSI